MKTYNISTKDLTNIPLVSIIIACYNDAEYIEQAISSSIAQTYLNKEIIVIDDGSNLETKKVLERLKPKIDKFVEQKNLGPSAARNTGLGEAKGEYILVLDSDDYFEKTFCEKAVNVIRKNIHVKLVTCYANRISPNGNDLFKPNGGYIEDFLAENSALGTSLFYRKDALGIGGYDEDMYSGFEDWEFFIRLLKNGGFAHVLREPLYNYRIRKGSTNYRANQEKYKIRKYIYLKHRDLYIKNFDFFVGFLTSLLEREENEKIKNLRRLEYKIGYKILKPLRIVKRKLKLKI